MLMSNEFVKARDSYRREVLRDQNRTGSKTGKVLAALVVTGAVALAACGVPADANTGVAGNSQSAVLADIGPTWGPNQALLSEFLNPRRGLDEVLGTEVEENELGVMPAPSWQPSQRAGDDVISRSDTNPVSDEEPSGHPNHGRLETYLGAAATSGPR